MDHLEMRMDTLRHLLLSVYGVYSSICDAESFRLLDTNAPESAMMEALLCLDEDNRVLPVGAAYQPDKLYFYSNAAGMIWIYSVMGTRAYVLGPAFTDNFSVIELMHRTDRYCFSAAIRAGMSAFVRHIPVVSTFRMWEYGIMQACCLTERTLTKADVIFLGVDHEQTQAEQQAAALSAATSYMLEQKLWNAVRTGNLEFMRGSNESMTNVSIGNITDGSHLRQDKNMSIVLTALCCRASVEGGLSPEIAYALSDRYIQKIEACRNVMEVTELSMGIMNDYIRRVHDRIGDARMSSQVRECCSYISLHPEENLDMDSLAAKYGYTPYYFSKKFKSEVGLPIREFIVRQKIEQAKIYLMDNRLTISDICERLGFANLSYFGSLFKKHTGMTPSQFRCNHEAARRKIND